ncbi:hypothetical protein INP83_12325 [Mucilaginibacter sp. 21P]|uniref:hypothetical protein n=1 Tax=Mucilaginibacter sp. 21P TaxID=2778902 RepID=UPI001C571751|nr:hypothetical protein [Mucilaginibacter sp. 21P]QXV63890.1 hypothetical protein INP83_12325 [Mucilaginibacter sp. 21P]
MKPNQAILERLNAITDKLSLLASLKEEEMRRPISDRDYKYLHFIWKEECVYNFAKNQFYWLLDLKQS